MDQSLNVKAYAQGRVNLMGEHTDYNGGYVLCTSTSHKTSVNLSPRLDFHVTVESKTPFLAENEKLIYLLGTEKAKNDWSDYVQGFTFILRKLGFKISGFDACIDSNIPIGMGMASSAALQVSLGKALREAFILPLTDLELAQIAQRVENEFVGAHVGIIDSMASAFLHDDDVLFIDTSDFSNQQTVRPSDLGLTVIYSGLSYQKVHQIFNQRRRECSEAARQLKVQCLSDIQLDDLQMLDRLPEVLKRRARHVITENARVLEAVSAIKKADLDRLGRLFELSHFSQRDDYEISLPEIDQLVNIALGTYGVFGARLTGCGLGGSVVICAEKSRLEEIALKIAWVYRSATGQEAKILCPGIDIDANLIGSDTYQKEVESKAGMYSDAENLGGF
jgi:galactokinase